MVCADITSIGAVAKQAVSVLCLAASLHAITFGQSANLAYQNRGGYSEGTRTEPSTGPASLDLIALLIDTGQPVNEVPAKFRAMFYLPRQDSVNLTIRELNPEYYYWLGDVEAGGWKAGQIIHFEWNTGKVIRSLNWLRRPLTLDQLGATARLGSFGPGQLEVVAPVALFHSDPPRLAELYRFVFSPGERMDLTFEVSPEGTNTPLAAERFSSVPARQPHLFSWRSGNAQDGWYRLTVSGQVLRNNARVARVVRFYHRRRLAE
jgi:hypothetical protein